MANGASVTVVVTVRAGKKKGTVTDSATVAAASPTDPNQANNSATLTTNVPITQSLSQQRFLAIPTAVSSTQ